MKRFAFLIPAAAAGTVVAVISAVFSLDATATYALFAVVALLVVAAGILRDLQGSDQRSVIVEMDEATIRAEQYDGPPSRELLIGVNERKENRILAENPVWVTARRTRIETFVFKSFRKRRVVSFSHLG